MPGSRRWRRSCADPPPRGSVGAEGVTNLQVTLFDCFDFDFVVEGSPVPIRVGGIKRNRTFAYYANNDGAGILLELLWAQGGNIRAGNSQKETAEEEEGEQE